MAPKIIFVEGNIGSGKSTFLDMASKHISGAKVVYEPLDVWKAYTDESGKNILQHFYEDPKRYAYTFQTIAFLSRVERLRELKNSTADYVFVERSIMSDRETFAKNCHLTGLMNKIEWDLYNSWFGWIKDMLDLPEATILYLRCEPEVSFARATSRGRKEEAGVPLEYLKQIHDRHDEWLIGHKDAVVVDASVNFRDNEGDLKEILKRVI